MTKTGRPPKPLDALQPVTIRVHPVTKHLMEKHGDTEYWRKVLETIAEIKEDFDQGSIPPEHFALIAGARTAQVTGIPSTPPKEPDDDTD